VTDGNVRLYFEYRNVADTVLTRLAGCTAAASDRRSDLTSRNRCPRPRTTPGTVASVDGSRARLNVSRTVCTVNNYRVNGRTRRGISRDITGFVRSVGTYGRHVPVSTSGKRQSVFSKLFYRQFDSNVLFPSVSLPNRFGEVNFGRIFRRPGLL